MEKEKTTHELIESFENSISESFGFDGEYYRYEEERNENLINLGNIKNLIEVKKIKILIRDKSTKDIFSSVKFLNSPENQQYEYNFTGNIIRVHILRNYIEKPSNLDMIFLNKMFYNVVTVIPENDLMWTLILEKLQKKEEVKPIKSKVYFSIEKDLMNEFDEYCDENAVSKSKLIENYIRYYLKNNK